jgi:plasmid stability protein
MGMVTVRDLDDRVKARLRERAARRGHSMEAEIREILAAAVLESAERPSLAEALIAGFDGVDVDLDLPDRSAEQHRPVDL